MTKSIEIIERALTRATQELETLKGGLEDETVSSESAKECLVQINKSATIAQLEAAELLTNFPLIT